MGIISIQNIAMSQMNLAMHVSFHSAVYAQIETQGLSTLGIAASLGKQYRDTLKLEQDAVKRTTGSDSTNAMRTADQKRDQVFLRILTKLKVAQYADAGSDLAAVWPLIEKKLIKQYPTTLANKAQHDETALLNGFVVDAKQFLTVEQRTTLGIASDLNALDDANAEFQAAFLNRSTELGCADNQVATELRAAVEEAYRRIVIGVNFEANNQAEDHAETAAACTTFVGTVNQVIKEYKARLKSLYGGTSASADPTQEPLPEPQPEADPNQPDPDMEDQQ